MHVRSWKIEKDRLEIEIPQVSQRNGLNEPTRNLLSLHLILEFRGINQPNYCGRKNINLWTCPATYYFQPTLKSHRIPASSQKTRDSGLRCSPCQKIKSGNLTAFSLKLRQDPVIISKPTSHRIHRSENPLFFHPF